MKTELKKELIRYFEYEGYKIYIYPKKIKDNAIEFSLCNPHNKLTRETIWIPKSAIEGKKDGIEYYGLDWLFDNNYENQQKLRKIGYCL